MHFGMHDLPKRPEKEKEKEIKERVDAKLVEAFSYVLRVWVFEGWLGNQQETTICGFLYLDAYLCGNGTVKATMVIPKVPGRRRIQRAFE